MSVVAIDCDAGEMHQMLGGAACAHPLRMVYVMLGSETVIGQVLSCVRGICVAVGASAGAAVRPNGVAVAVCDKLLEQHAASPGAGSRWKLATMQWTAAQGSLRHPCGVHEYRARLMNMHMLFRPSVCSCPFLVTFGIDSETFFAEALSAARTHLDACARRRGIVAVTPAHHTI